MGVTSLYVIPLVCSIGAGPSTHFKVAPTPPLPGGYISEEDARYLDYLLDDFLFDPRRAVRVRLKTSTEISDGTASTIHLGRARSKEGWFVAGRDGAADRIFFTDGDSILAKSVKFERVDFERDFARSVPIDDIGFDPDDESLATAAWLYRRGFMTLAARALAWVRRDNLDPRERLRNHLAKHAFSQFRAAFFGGADREAMEHANRLSRLYPEFAAECHILPIVVADLNRRHREGTFGKPIPKALPSDYAKWDVTAKITYLVRQLDRIENTSRDEIHVAALTQLGDAVVPALIDVVERDERLTQSSDLLIQSRFTHRRPDQLVYVRDVALQLLGAILRVQHLDPYGDPIAIDCNPPADLAERFRHYWDQYGKMPFLDRMIGVLTDPNARPSAKLDAAEELVSVNTYSRSSWNRQGMRRPNPLRSPHSYLTKFKSPTVREAIFDALDQELARHKKESLTVNGVNWFVVRYVYCLEKLGDPNAGPELARRAGKADSTLLRLRYADAAHELGESGALISFVRDMNAGKVELATKPDDESLRSFEDGPFDQMISMLVRCKLREVDEALHLLADRDHPLYPLAVASAHKEDFQDRWTRSSTLRHPVRLVLLAQKLNDFRPTGVHYYLRGDEVGTSGEPRGANRRYRDRSLPTGTLVEHAEERVADEFAHRLLDMIVGLPPSHPLQHDVDLRLKKMKEFIDLHARRLRPVTWVESRKWDVFSLNRWYVPDITPLGRPATAGDVKLGRAVFELNGRGTVAKQVLPAWLVLKSDANSHKPDYGLVVQAEADADGKLIYGVIFQREIRIVRAEEVERLEPYKTD